MRSESDMADSEICIVRRPTRVAVNDLLIQSTNFAIKTIFSRNFRHEGRIYWWHLLYSIPRFSLQLSSLHPCVGSWWNSQRRYILPTVYHFYQCDSTTIQSKTVGNLIQTGNHRPVDVLESITPVFRSIVNKKYKGPMGIVLKKLRDL